MDIIKRSTIFLFYLVLCDGCFNPTLSPNRRMVRCGQIVLGGILRIFRLSKSQPCSLRLHEHGNGVQQAEAMYYAIRQINKDPNILPDIKLGTMIADGCNKESTVTSTALTMMPTDQDQKCVKDSLRCTRRKIYQLPFVNVGAVLCMTSSQPAISVSNIMQNFRTPVLGVTASADVLGDRNLYPNFMRIVPPDRYQVIALLSFLHKFGWKYFSVLYSNEAYGVGGYNRLRQYQGLYDSCIYYSQSVTSEFSKEEFALVLKRLRSNSGKARAVVLYFPSGQARDMMNYFMELGVRAGEFIWIGSESAAEDIWDGYERILDGYFGLRLTGPVNHDFKKYFESRNVINNRRNPWMRKYWEAIFDCSWRYFHKRKCERNWTLSEAPLYAFDDVTGIVIEAVNITARALDRVVRENCPNATEDFEYCIKSEEMMNALENITAERLLQGFMNRPYNYVQLQKSNKSGNKYAFRDIGHWDLRTLTLDLNEDLISWKVWQNAMPKSTCSDHCNSSEVYVRSSLSTCCWTCQNCMAWQIANDNQTFCQDCEWLYQANSAGNQCESIPPAPMQWDNPIVIVLIVLAGVGAISVAVLIGIFLWHRNKALIKATSLELSLFIMVGCFLSYGMVWSFIPIPNLVLCYVQRQAIGLSFALLYAPLLAKTLRIYRIFKAGEKFQRHLRLVGSNATIALTLVLILLQFLLIAATYYIEPPTLTYYQQRRNVPDVETLCSHGKASLAIPVTYNLVLMVACLVLAFVTRKIPSNFKETWHIFLSVSMTVFVYLAFIPTYFMTNTSLRRVMFAFSLIVNTTVNVVCIFAPRIYALFFVKESPLKGRQSLTGSSSTFKFDDSVYPSKSDSDVAYIKNSHEHLLRTSSSTRRLTPKKSDGTEKLDAEKLKKELDQQLEQHKIQ